MRFPFFRNRDSVKNGILISIRRTGDGFHPGLFSQLFPAHRLLLSVIVYFIFYMIIYALSMGALIIFKLLPGIALSANTVNEAASMSTYLTGTFLISLVLSAVMAVIQYVITHLILTRKLNLI